MMKKKALAASILAVSTAAYAGLRQSYPVQVFSTHASGSVASARNSANSTESLECWTYSAGSGGCSARSAAGVNAMCSFGVNANLAATVRSINGDSWVAFYFDTAGTCTSIQVNNGSYYEPKQ